MADLFAVQSLADSVTGYVERIVFVNGEDGFSVLRVRLKGRDYKKPTDVDTLLANVIEVNAGEHFTARGRWDNHKAHGLQFVAESMETIAPNSLAGIERYLGSGLIKGIGPTYARRLAQTFGEGVFDVIEHSPEKLLSVEGIGKVRADRIVKSYSEQASIRTIMKFLVEHGVSTNRAVRIYKTYGDSAVDKIKQNPYCLARDIHGIGFKTADEIAGRVGVSKMSVERARAGLIYVLQDAVSNGHVCLPEEDLRHEAGELLVSNEGEVSKDILDQAQAWELMDNSIVIDTVRGRRCVFLASLYQTEKQLAERLVALSKGALPWPAIDVEKAIPWLEEKNKISLAANQRDAIRLAASSKVLVVTGGPGTGKTTTVNSILALFLAKKMRVMLCAPTGQAAKRMAKTTGFDAKTIHRLLVARKGGVFEFNRDNPLDCDVLVVDEASMVDIRLALSVVNAVAKGAALILVGDVDQLACVGPGQVLADIIASGVIPVVRLTEIFRQAAGSKIITNAHRVNHGDMPEFPEPGATSDFYFKSMERPEDDQLTKEEKGKVVAERTVRSILRMVTETIPKQTGFDPKFDIQVLTPSRRSSTGVTALNIALQAALNPLAYGAPSVERFGYTYRVGDKVMQTANDYDKNVFNGDVGYITALSLDAKTLVIDFDGVMVEYDFDELDQITLSFASSIHKSQGSQYPVVIIPITTQHFTMLQRNLLYTGMTRGAKLVIVVGQKKAVAMAVRNQDASKRWSKLNEWLKAA